MSFQRKIGLRLLRTKHWLHRHWVAAAYAIRLHWELESVREKLIRKFGKDWVQIRFPGLTHARLADSAWTLVRLASNPKVDRVHRERTARWKVCLRKLRKLNSPHYLLTEPVSQRLYHAALQRCLSELTGECVSVPTWAGPFHGGLAIAIRQWLESTGIDQDPVVMALPRASSAHDPLETIQLPTGVPSQVANDTEEMWVVAVRQQYEAANEGSLQELHAAYLRCYLSHVGLAKALVVTSEVGST